MLFAAVNDAALFAQSTYYSSGSTTYSPAALLFGAVFLLVWLYLAYKCAANGHVALFVLGFCFPLLWLIGAIMGKRHKY